MVASATTSGVRYRDVKCGVVRRDGRGAVDQVICGARRRGLRTVWHVGIGGLVSGTWAGEKTVGRGEAPREGGAGRVGQVIETRRKRQDAEEWG